MQQTIDMSSPNRTIPLGIVSTSTSRVTIVFTQLIVPSVYLSLPTFLIPTWTMGVNPTSHATTIGGTSSSSLF